jgi:hypothetical protein
MMNAGDKMGRHGQHDVLRAPLASPDSVNTDAVDILLNLGDGAVEVHVVVTHGVREPARNLKGAAADAKLLAAIPARLEQGVEGARRAAAADNKRD